MKMYKKKSSIFAKILLPMFIVAALQSAVFLGIVFRGGVAEGIDNNAYARFSQQVESRRNEFQNQLKKWMDIGSAAADISAMHQTRREENLADDDKGSGFLLSINRTLLSVLRQNRVNGAFFILSGKENPLPTAELPQTKYGIGIRDLDPDGSGRNNGDIIIERAPAAVATQIGFALDSWWESAYTFTDAQESGYYYQPLQAALENESRNSLDYGYWSVAHQISKDDTEVISYSVPVFAKDGSVIGVLGIELATSYLQTFLPSVELGTEKNGVYILANKNEDGSYRQVLSDGHMYSRYFLGEGGISLDKEPFVDSCFDIAAGSGSTSAVVSVSPVATYNPNSPFYDDSYYLLGTIDRSELLAFGGSVKLSVILASVAAFLLSIAGAFVAGKIFSTPVKKLVSKVRSGLGGNRRLGRIGVSEIDELIQAIEQLNISVFESEYRVSEIIRMSGMVVGTFRVDKKENKAFISDGFFQILEGVFPKKEEVNSREDFDAGMEALEQHLVLRDFDEHSRVYHFPQTDRWVRVKESDKNLDQLGIVLDVTQEMKEREKIEYERDHDVLTELINRRAFHKQLKQLFGSAESLGMAAMVMMDVDNLKYVNDSFGHDLGDAYLKTVAAVIRSMEGKGSLVSRISGDEFLLFLYGYASKAEVLERIEALKNRFAKASMPLPNGEVMRVRVSGGIAWYPDDSNEPNSLIKFADFAMLQTKKSHKGNFDFFVSEEYRQNRYLVESVDEINKMIDDELLDFHFQPIVNIKEGTIHGYEALMRPMSGSITSPAEALILAEAIGSLYQIERLTWLGALKKFAENAMLVDDGTKIFINSIPNQSLSDKDGEFVVRNYEKLLGRLVVEIIESERLNNRDGEEFRKLEVYGVRLAIDDYGSGYNSQAMLLNTRVDYVKIDMSIVRGVASDPNRQEIIQDILKYGRERGIKIIAEGVETWEELRVLRGLGVQFVQGFLLQRPTPLPTGLSAEVVGELKALMKDTQAEG